jgi:hypothetical protein
LEGIAELAQRHDLVFTDEIYEYFVYDQRKHVSFASLPDMAERTITISGYTKTYSITGWRIGYAVASQWAELIGAMMILCMCVRLLPCNMAWQRVFESLAIIFTRTYSNPFSPSEIDFVRCWTGWAWRQLFPRMPIMVRPMCHGYQGPREKNGLMYILKNQVWRVSW